MTIAKQCLAMYIAKVWLQDMHEEVALLAVLPKEPR